MKERLFKKKCFEVLCACCASDGCCHFTCVICACFNICCNEHVWYVHGALHVVMSKKTLEMSIEYLKRATFIIKKEVGGRELTKLWVYSLVLPSQLRFPPNVFFPNFVRGGEWSKVWIDVQWWGVHPFCFPYDKRKSKVWMREHEICSTDFPILLCEKKSEWATRIQSKKTVWTLVYLGDLTRCGVWNVWTYWYVYMLLYVLICIRDVYI